MFLIILISRELFALNIICLYIKLKTEVKNKSLLSNIYLLMSDFLRCFLFSKIRVK